jgi:hypothetical protein
MNEIVYLIRLFQLPNGMAIGCYPYKDDYDAFSFGSNAEVTVKAHRVKPEVIIDTQPMALERAMDFAEQFLAHSGNPQFVKDGTTCQGVHVVLPYTLETLVRSNIRFQLPGGKACTTLRSTT